MHMSMYMLGAQFEYGILFSYFGVFYSAVTCQRTINLLTRISGEIMHAWLDGFN